MPQLVLMNSLARHIERVPPLMNALWNLEGELIERAWHRAAFRRLGSPVGGGAVLAWCAGRRASHAGGLFSRPTRAGAAGVRARQAEPGAGSPTLFRVAESTVYRWLQTWRTEGRREAKPHAGGPAPRLDAAALEKLKDHRGRGQRPAALAEYAARLRSAPAWRRAARPCAGRCSKLGLPRKKDAAGAGAGPARTSPPPAPPGGPSWPRSTRGGWSSSMRAGSTPA